MKLDYTFYQKGRCEDSYYKKYVSLVIKPKHWDKNSFITWILCGAPVNKDLPRLISKELK